MSEYREGGSEFRSTGRRRPAIAAGLVGACVCALLLQCGAAFSQGAEEFYRVDPRLQRPVNKHWKNPTLEQMVEWLSEETGLPIQVLNYESYPLKNQPIAAETSATGTPIWTAMRTLEGITRVHGTWEPTSTGYNFVIGKVEVPQPPGGPEGPQPGGRWLAGRLALLALGTVALAFVIALVALRRGRALPGGSLRQEGQMRCPGR
jgi:hypothetical protein